MWHRYERLGLLYEEEIDARHAGRGGDNQNPHAQIPKTIRACRAIVDTDLSAASLATFVVSAHKKGEAYASPLTLTLDLNGRHDPSRPGWHARQRWTFSPSHVLLQP